MSSLKANKSLPGIHLKHHKNTHDSHTVDMPVPAKVTIVMSQHMGTPCIPTVQVGDQVQVGQLLGENRGKLCAPIFSSVSGTVTGLIDSATYGGLVVPAVVIETDGKQTIHESVKPPVINTKEDFLEAIYREGMVGLGGAGFPTHTKLSFEQGKVDTLIINAAECEPYITSDNRECVENSDDIIEGIEQIQKYLNIAKAYIGIEDNKTEAIQILSRKAEGRDGISVMRLKSRYPQGAEKVLIYSTTGRVVPEGEIPASVGVVVMNVTTISKFNRYLRTGMPLIAKRLTVDGDCIAHPENVRVLIGTPIQEVIDFCGGLIKPAKKILCGGPMMGVAVLDTSMPVIKNNNAILALSKDESKIQPTTGCIRCGKCIFACPVKLMPLSLEKAYDAQDVEQLEKLSVGLCINCGCCSYVCPAKRNLAQKNQLAKDLVKQSK